MRIPIAQIRTDGGTQTRAALDVEHANEIADAFRAERSVAPVVVFHDGEAYWLADGFHRVTGAKSACLDAIEVDVRQGTRRDAVLFSVGANAAHGLKRTNADKRRAVETLLRDEEWRGWSDRKISDVAGVSNKFVGDLRREQPTVNGTQSTTRQATDGRVMNTANIGRKPEASHAEPSLFAAPKARVHAPPPVEDDDDEDSDEIARANNPQGLVVVEPEPEPEPEAKPRGWGEHDLSLYVGNMSALMTRLATDATRLSATVDPRWQDEARERVAGVVGDAIDVLLKLMPSTAPRRAALTMISGGKK